MLYIFYFLVCMISKKKKAMVFLPFFICRQGDFSIFSLSLVFCSLSVICLGVPFFFSLAFLIICEYPESVVWFMSLILESSQQLLHHIFLPLCSFFLPHLRYQLYIWNCHTVLVCSIHSFFLLFFHFSLRRFYWHIFKFFDSLFSYTQVINKSIKGILYFYCSVLIFNISFWLFLRVFISLPLIPICFPCWLIFN